VRFADSRMTTDERRALELLEQELRAQREDEYQRLKAERFGAPCEPFVNTRCLNCGGTLVLNDGGFYVHQGHPNCTHPTVSIEEVRR